jgi:hypothetical protein
MSHACRVVAAWVVLGGAVSASAQVPSKTRAEIVRYAATGIGSPYVWGGGNWDPNNRTFGGADCSGFVSKSWSLTQWSPYRTDLHGYSTSDFIETPGPYWTEVDRGALIYGDAIVYRYNSNQSGHTYIYLAGDGWGEHEVYEARGTDYGIVHRWRTTYSAADVTKGIRRTGLLETVDVTGHIVEVDDGAPGYADAGMTGSSAVESSAPGCREGNGRYRWVTAVRNETCTFRPTLPETGWYRVYVTCNQDSPNVQNVGVTVNDTLGTQRFVWDQSATDQLNTWVLVGSGAFLFSAGTAGTVVWDDFTATPTDGAHVFRGDATKFVLDNRIEVDGVGGQPGRFATLSAALAWLRGHESEEPDVIDITCNALNDTGCLELNVWDDLTINGDADGDGVPVTLAVMPGTAAEWARACALYLNIPIQHHYTLRDVVVIPQFVSAGYATGAYGLVIDEQNPSGEASAWELTLESVTVGASRPGNLPTAPEIDARTSATRFGGTDANYGAAVLQLTSTWAGDDGCRQTVHARDLVITHSATRGLAVQGAYTQWEIAGGLVVSFNALEGIRAEHLGSSVLNIHGAADAAPNRIFGNSGGGIVNVGDAGVGSISVGNCTISDNVSSTGGGVLSQNATTLVHGSLLVHNQATGAGGAATGAGGTVTLNGCTIVANTAAAGAGGVVVSSGQGALLNSIVWGNSGSQQQGVATVSYCAVQGGCAGTGNLADDPLFVAPASGDYHILRSSPCVNAGNPAQVPADAALDLDGQARILGGSVEMGADELLFWAGDLDHDGDVDSGDVAGLIACLAGPDVPPAPAAPLTAADCTTAFDYSEDADVDLADFAGFRLRAASLMVADVILEVRNAAGSLLPAPAYVESGAWANSTAKSQAAGLSGSGSRFITYVLPNTGTDNATFVPQIAVSGVYELFVTWSTGANCYDAQYTIRHADGQTVLLVDQIPEGVAGANANTWVSLGQYRFAVGQASASGSVNVSEATVTGKPHPTWNQRVYADAARWVFVAP